jgi:hypothetical protein
MVEPHHPRIFNTRIVTTISFGLKVKTEKHDGPGPDSELDNSQKGEICQKGNCSWSEVYDKLPI